MERHRRRRGKRMPACRLHRRKGGRRHSGASRKNSRSPLRRDPSSSAGAAGRLCVAGGRGRMCAVAPCRISRYGAPARSIGTGRWKALRRGRLTPRLPGGAYAPRTGDICQCRRAVPYGRGRAASGGAGPGALCESLLLEWMLRHELTHIKRGHIVCKAVLLSCVRRTLV